MKYQHLTRLFIADSIEKNSLIISKSADVHYLLKVMRKKIGDKFIIFNNISGEFLVEIIEANGKTLLINIVEQLREKVKEKEINLIFAPIKHTRINFLLEKATELGVTKLIPVITDHSVVDKVNNSKWDIYIKEAAEQCRRISIPEVLPLINLKKLIESWDVKRKILWCNEKEEVQHFINFKDENACNILIGPEGGFSAKEIDLLLSKDFIESVHLGNRILRSETAAITALAYANL